MTAPDQVEREMTRPNGKVYRPRRGLRAHAWEDDDRDERGVIVFGTLDPQRAQEFANRMCAYWYGMPEAVTPIPGWYRDGFQYGQRAWVCDDERGAAGVMFRAYDQDDI